MISPKPAEQIELAFVNRAKAGIEAHCSGALAQGIKEGGSSRLGRGRVLPGHQ
jgi:hypothetical protein